jgi:hypothetical protein
VGLLLVLLGVAGCQSARFVVADEKGGVVAIPSNTDMWPFKYRSQAEELMARKCPQGYRIVHEEEVVVGQTTVARDSTDSQSYDVTGKKHTPPSTVTTTAATHTTETQDRTEYRITFVAKSN